MVDKKKKIVVFDLWETLIFGTEDSAISIFYQDITGEEISPEQQKRCLLIAETEPARFLERFFENVTPSQTSSMLLSLKNPRSPLKEKIIQKFRALMDNDAREIRWVPGAMELLAALKKKYTLVVVSNLWAYQKEFLSHKLAVGDCFDRCLFSCDLGMDKNDILRQLGEILSADTRDMVYVGRSYEYDIVPAVNADISAIRITYENNMIFPEKITRMIEEELDGVAAPIARRSFVAQGGRRDVLLVIPPFYKLLGSHNNRLNMGAAFISSRLDSLHIPNRTYHCDSEPHENYVTRYQMVFNSVEFYDHLAGSEAFPAFEEYFRAHGSDTVFVTCGDILNPSFDSGNWDSSQKIAKIVRKVNPRAYIVAVGPEVGLASEDFDLIVHDEVESLLPAILENHQRGRINGGLLSEHGLKSLPPFRFETMATEISPPSLDTILWRRGCAGTCDFCRVAEINKGKIRCRPRAAVMEDIRIRYENYGIRNFYIIDANFTADKAMALEFCREVTEKFPGITWRVESRYDTLDVELLRSMKAAGCTHLKLGLENALSERHQVKTKRVSLAGAAEWIKVIQEVGINCVIYLMLGGKWFNRAQYEEMFANTKALRADGYTVSLYNPYPNTPAGISYEEWRQRRFTGSHLDIRLIDFWKIPIEVVEAFFNLEIEKGREDKMVRRFI